MSVKRSQRSSPTSVVGLRSIQSFPSAPLRRIHEGGGVPTSGVLTRMASAATTGAVVVPWWKLNIIRVVFHRPPSKRYEVSELGSVVGVVGVPYCPPYSGPLPHSGKSPIWSSPDC